MSEVACSAEVTEAAMGVVERPAEGVVDERKRQAATWRELKEHAVQQRDALPPNPLAPWSPTFSPFAPGGVLPSAMAKLHSARAQERKLEAARSAVVAAMVGVVEKPAETTADKVQRLTAWRKLEELCVPSCGGKSCDELGGSTEGAVGAGTCAALEGYGCDCSGCLCGSAAPPSPPSMPPLPPAPPISPKPPLVAMEIATYAELRQQLAAATPGSSLAFTLAPGEVLEVEESLVIAGISVSISSLPPGAAISRAMWANNSRIFHVRDAGHLSLSRVSIANGTTNGEDGGGILVEGTKSILTAEFLVVSDCQVLDFGGLFVSENGGGIAAITGAELRLNCVRVERCRANNGGGVAFVGSSTGVLTDCHILDCTLNPSAHGLGFGAGLSLLFRSIVSWLGGSIDNCLVPAGAGGGWGIGDSMLHMTDAVISGCTSPHAGAGYLGSRYHGDPTGVSTANLTNVSISGW